MKRTKHGTERNQEPAVRRSQMVSSRGFQVKFNGNGDLNITSSTAECAENDIKPEEQLKLDAEESEQSVRQENSEIQSTSFTLLRGSERTADWDAYLMQGPKAVDRISPVSFFKCAPFSRIWKDIAKVGMHMEVAHPYSVGSKPVYAVATVAAFAGYKALIKFESVEESSNYMTWISFCSKVPKPVGYALKKGYLLLPVEGHTSTDYGTLNENLVRKHYSGNEMEPSLPDNHYEVIQQELKKSRKFKLMDLVEAMDKEEPVRNRLAYVIAIVGDRIHVQYVDASKQDQGFCFNMYSELVHPLGWSKAVGQQLKSQDDSKLNFPHFSQCNFSKWPVDITIIPDMVFEVRHPFFPSKIVAGSVLKMLNYGHFVAKIETNAVEEYAEFVFHITSDYVLPCGFCKTHNLQLEVPLGEDDRNFSWQSYYFKKRVFPLDVSKVLKKITHKFVKGCKLEAVDIFQPLYVGPATVKNVADHLLYIHFDGWPMDKTDYYQWVSAFSRDIYPAGWAELTAHCFQGHVIAPKFEDMFYIATSTSSGYSSEREAVQSSSVSSLSSL